MREQCIEKNLSNPEQQWLKQTEMFIPPLGRECFPDDHIMRTYKNASAALKFDHRNKIISIGFLESYPKGMGHASAIIDLIKNLCLEFDYSLKGNAAVYDPFDKSRDPTEEEYKKLHKWYRKHGIEVYGEYNYLKFPLQS